MRGAKHKESGLDMLDEMFMFDEDSYAEVDCGG